MKIRTAVAILLLIVFAFSTIAITRIEPVRASGGSSSTLTLPDAELMLSEFTKQWGPGALTGKVDVAGPGVQFDFTGLASAETGVGDDFAVNALAGGGYKDYGYGFAGYYDFSAYTRYCMVIENVGTESVDVCLFVNTGWTGDWSGGLWTGPDGFGASLARDTCWESGTYVSIGPSESKAVCLDFSSATCYNAGDDPVVTWQHPDGTPGVTVQRLDEVSNIGFHVCGDGAGSIVAKGTQLYIDPPEVNKAPSDIDSFFDVCVTLENFADFAGFDLNLTWDGTMITCTSVGYTIPLDALWGTDNYFVVEQSGTGFYKIVAVALATSATNTGASVLFQLTFRIDRSCNFPLSTPIHFAVVKLSDDAEPAPNPIIAAVTDGAYYISDTVPDLEFELVDPDLNYTLTLSDAEFMLSEFTKQWGPGTLTGKVDVAGLGVQFDFTGLVTTAGTGVGDDFAVNALAGGAYKDYGYGFAGYYDFSGYTRYCQVFENVGTEPVDVCLFINTGWTNDWSGGLWTGPDGYGASLARDTYWQSGFVSIGPSESKAVCLDFSSATCWNAEDDPVAAWQHPNGTSGVTVQRLDETSNIGFQVLGDGAGSIVAKGTQLYAEYCKTFEVAVYATHICANLKDYDFSILYTSELLRFAEVDAWGVLGDTSDQADVDDSVPGEIHIWDTGGLTWTGDKGLLFTLTFHVEFDDSPTHIWRTTTQPNILVAQISLQDATLSFEEGTIPLSGITVIGSPITVTIHLIRGDVDCDGTVGLLDLRVIAYYYDVEQGDLEWATASKYDLNGDNTIDIFDLVIVAGNYGYPY